MKKQWPLDTAVSFDPYFGEPGRDGDQGYEINEDGTVKIRIKAPYAKEVVIDMFGNIFPFEKVTDEMWEGNFDLGRGFKYFFLKIDHVIKCIWCYFRLRSGKWLKNIRGTS